MTLKRLSLALLTTCLFTVPAAGQQWKIGLASVKITPTEPVRMSGYASRTGPSQGIAHDLFAKALAIEDGQGHRAVLVTSDVIGFKKSFAESTCSRISEKTGLKRSQILLSSSHVHTGPTLELDESNLEYPEDQAKATVRYTKSLQDKLVELVMTSLNRFEPARLSWGVGVATFVMNRREFTERGVRLGVNPAGLVDRSVPVLRIDSPDGQLRGVLFGTACHNTTLGGNNMQISGDFAGYAQALIQRSRPNAQAMFITGCAGDANPFPRGSEELARLHGASLGQEVLRVLDTELSPVLGPLNIEMEDVELPIQPFPSPADIEELANQGGWQRFVAEKMRETLKSTDIPPDSYKTAIALWQFGDDLTLIALPGEVVVDYVTMLRDTLGPRKLWIAAYCNDVFGYLPSSRVLRQGGYETRGIYYGGIGFFSPEAQGVVMRKVSQVARKAGRRVNE